jgi:colanic acid biosynthesis glycosyl transferase WcaI
MVLSAEDGKMNVLVITPYYLPDSGPSAPLYAMLCQALVKRGHEVAVISAVPHYPSGQVKAEHQHKRTTKTVEDGVQVIRVPLPSMDRSRFAQRLLQFLIYQLRATVVGMREHYDVLLFSNPFLMVGIPFAFLAVMRRKPAVYSVHDVYPDVGIKLGIFRHPWVIRLVTSLERYCLDRAVFVRILSESFAPSMRSLGVSDAKTVLIYDWVDTDLIQPMSRENSFSREHGLVDSFVVLYAGNIGLSQGLENVLTAAEKLSGVAEIRFVFVGDGAGRERLEKDAAKRGLTKVLFIPFQPRARLPEVLATADVSLVILQKGIGSGSLPSKSYSILASGRPLLASVDTESDMARLVERSQGGICVPPEDPEALAQAIRTLKANPLQREKFGINGRAYALKFHSPVSAAEQFDELLRKAIVEYGRN